MALNNAAVLKIDKGNYFTAPTGTEIPADLTQISTPWENFGHTSLEDILSASSEGGEATVLGTLQSPQLRTAYSNRTESFAVTLQQFDAKSLKHYFGKNMVDVKSNGSLLGVPATPTPTISAFLAVYVDGSKMFAIWIPKAEIMRGDDFELADTEKLAGLPIKITPVIADGKDFAYAVTPLGDATGSETGSGAGTNTGG